MDEEANSKNLIFLESQPHITDFHVFSSSAALQLSLKQSGFWFQTGYHLVLCMWSNDLTLTNFRTRVGNTLKKKLKIHSLNVKCVSVSFNANMIHIQKIGPIYEYKSINNTCLFRIININRDLLLT